MIGQTIGNLKIVAELGKGGMGVVYLAEHVRLHKKFAVKSLSPELTRDPLFSERFYLEAKNQALLDHPNIVQATDFYEEHGQYLLVMEYVEGQELGDLIRQKGKLPEREALAIIKDVLSGLGFAHRKGLIHRDMKPSNVLVDTDGRARIMDFGIAILAGEKRLTSTGSNIGTPWYMSPEQIARPREVDNRSDIYSVGIVLFEMLTGDVPFDGETEFSVQEQQINAPAPNPSGRNPGIPAAVSRIVLKAMEKGPGQRYQSCEEFLEDIRRYEAGSRDTGMTRPKKSRRLLWVSSAIALFLLCAAALYVFSVISKSNTVTVTTHGAGSGAGDTVGPGKQPAPAPVSGVAMDPAGISKDTEKGGASEHEAVYSLIQSALHETSMICKHIREIPLKRKNLELAKNEKDAVLINHYRKNIEDLTLNISDGIKSFDRLMIELSNNKQEVVLEEIGNLQKRAVDPSKIVFVKNRYQVYVETGKKVEARNFLEYCTRNTSSTANE